MLRDGVSQQFAVIEGSMGGGGVGGGGLHSDQCWRRDRFRSYVLKYLANAASLISHFQPRLLMQGAVAIYC